MHNLDVRWPNVFSGRPSHLKIGFEDVEVAARWLSDCMI